MMITKEIANLTRIRVDIENIFVLQYEYPNMGNSYTEGIYVVLYFLWAS